MPLTKSDIDALVDGMRDCGDDTFVSLAVDDLGYVAHKRSLRKSLYLAAGLSADGSRKPARVRCYSITQRPHSNCPAVTVTMNPGDACHGELVTPGWFVPDGEGK